MDSVNCPHCDATFVPEDHREPGDYECPECSKEMWIDVEITFSYVASCKDSDHEWEVYINDSFPNVDLEYCQKCGKMRVKK